MKNNLFITCIVLTISLFNVFVEAAEQTALQPLSISFADHPQWKLQVPHDGPVIYQGVVSFDDAGSEAMPVLYPASNLAEMFAVVFVHGAIAEAAKNKQKNEIQIKADQVLLSYKNILDNFTYYELMQRVVETTFISDKLKPIKNTDFPVVDNEVVIQNTPVFLMTQDHKAIVLNNQFAIRNLDDESKEFHRASVRVISTKLDVDDPISFWNENDGENLKANSAELLAGSLDIFLSDISSNFDGYPYKTVRYHEGGSEKIERAQIIKKECNRMLLRNLRGILMSVPAPSKTVEGDCKSTHSH